MSIYDKWPPFKMTLARIVIAQSQLVNALLLGFPDESISGRCGRAIKTGRPKDIALVLSIILDTTFALLFGEEDHCANAVREPNDYDRRPELWRWYHDIG